MILFQLFMIFELIKFSNELDRRNSPIIYLDTFYSKEYYDRLDEPIEWFNPNYKLYGIN